MDYCRAYWIAREMFQVRALYKFEAQPNSGELSISVDEILTVVREVSIFSCFEMSRMREWAESSNQMFSYFETLLLGKAFIDHFFLF